MRGNPGRGGKQPGAGRPKGVPNKRTNASITELIELAEKKGWKLPLQYMLEVMNDDRAVEDRKDKFAIALAPYFYARLTTTMVQGDDNKPLTIVLRQFNFDDI